MQIAEFEKINIKIYCMRINYLKIDSDIYQKIMLFMLKFLKSFNGLKRKWVDDFKTQQNQDIFWQLWEKSKDFENLNIQTA